MSRWSLRDDFTHTAQWDRSPKSMVHIWCASTSKLNMGMSWDLSQRISDEVRTASASVGFSSTVTRTGCSCRIQLIVPTAMLRTASNLPVYRR